MARRLAAPLPRRPDTPWHRNLNVVPHSGEGSAPSSPKNRPRRSPPPVAVVEARQPQREVDLDLIDPNPLQPRTRFDDVKLQELAESISSAGLVQPIVVRRKGERFEIVAGERRWRAAQIAGLLKLPVHVSDVSDEKLLQTALIENIQREDLNPIEEAQAYKRLGDESGLTQEQIAVAVGKDRASIANYLRLLRLPEQVRARVASGELSMGHARALLVGRGPRRPAQGGRPRGGERVVGSRHRSARPETVRAASRTTSPSPTSPEKDVHTRQAEERLRVVLGTRVNIQRKGKGGRVEIEFVNEDELIRLYEYLVER